MRVCCQVWEILENPYEFILKTVIPLNIMMNKIILILILKETIQLKHFGKVPVLYLLK